MPSLSALRLGSQNLLDWLYESYWEPHSRDLSALSDAATTMLTSYQKVAAIIEDSSPTVFYRACSASIGTRSGSSGSSSNNNDRLLQEAIKNIIQSSSSVFLGSFFLPALVFGGTAGEFLMGGGGGGGEIETDFFRLRRWYAPLLLSLERSYRRVGVSLTLLIFERMSSMSDSTAVISRKSEPYLLHWFNYLLSRDWQSFHDMALSSYSFRGRGIGDGGGGIKFYLRNKAPDKWTEHEAKFMASPAPLHVLDRGGYPVRQLLEASKGMIGALEEVRKILEEVVQVKHRHIDSPFWGGGGNSPGFLT